MHHIPAANEDNKKTHHWILIAKKKLAVVYKRGLFPIIKYLYVFMEMKMKEKPYHNKTVMKM